MTVMASAVPGANRGEILGHSPERKGDRHEGATGGHQGSGVFLECPHLSLIEAVEAEGFGGGSVVASAFGDVQVAGVFDGRGDGGAEGRAPSRG